MKPQRFNESTDGMIKNKGLPPKMAFGSKAPNASGAGPRRSGMPVKPPLARNATQVDGFDKKERNKANFQPSSSTNSHSERNNLGLINARTRFSLKLLHKSVEIIVTYKLLNCYYSSVAFFFLYQDICNC